MGSEHDDAPTVTDIVTAVRAGRLSARQATEDALARIEKHDGRIGAFQQVRVFAALSDADALDARADLRELPLAGLPIAIKDNVPVSGEPMRTGSAGTDPSPQSDDHEVVQRLRDAGAVVVGLTRVPELCVFGATDSVHGITRNPWNLERTPGGSSGGAAAAVASGMVPAAHGNDGMGSIRIPSACCGVVGLKAGAGVVPSDLGNGSWFGMAENGVLTTTVADQALVFSVLAARPELAAVAAPGRLRIGLSTTVPALGVPLDRHYRAAVQETGDLLADAGHDVSTADPAYGSALALPEIAHWTAGTEMDARQVADRSRLEPRIRRHAAVGRMVMRLGGPWPGPRERWRTRAEAYFAGHDILVTPALAQSPKAAKQWGERGWLANIVADVRYAPFAAPWNLIGWPAMAVPAGLHPNGMPLSVQLVGPPGSEARLLAVAAQLESARPWPRVAPGY